MRVAMLVLIAALVTATEVPPAAAPHPALRLLERLRELVADPARDLERLADADADAPADRRRAALLLLAADLDARLEAQRRSLLAAPALRTALDEAAAALDGLDRAAAADPHLADIDAAIDRTARTIEAMAFPGDPAAWPERGPDFLVTLRWVRGELDVLRQRHAELVAKEPALAAARERRDRALDAVLAAYRTLRDAEPAYAELRRQRDLVTRLLREPGPVPTGD